MRLPVSRNKIICNDVIEVRNRQLRNVKYKQTDNIRYIFDFKISTRNNRADTIDTISIPHILYARLYPIQHTEARTPINLCTPKQTRPVILLPPNLHLLHFRPQ